MPELTPKERLQPSLLDRLTDDEPDKHVESHEKRVLSASKLKALVVRDLGWLLNTDQLSTCQDMEDCPLAKKSVINFGTPALSGVTASAIQPRRLSQDLADAIRNFEPRLTDGSVQVTVDIDEDVMDTSTLRFQVEAELWSQPIPLQLFLMTEVDLETGHFEITPASRGQNR